MQVARITEMGQNLSFLSYKIQFFVSSGCAELLLYYSYMYT